MRKIAPPTLLEIMGKWCQRYQRGEVGREDVGKLYQFATHARRQLGMSLEFFHAVERAGEL